MASNVEIHHDDSLKFLRSLPDRSIAAAITDPPYGINYLRGGSRMSKYGWRDYREDGDWDQKRPDKVYFDELRRVARVVIVWGGNYFTDYLPPSQQWLVWDKGQRDFSLADCELAWSSQNKASRVFTYPRTRAQLEGGLHPTQKPVALMKWCLELCTKRGDTVIDPFMGSGSMGAACIRTGRNFIGVERIKKYFLVAEKRLTDEARQMILEI